MEQKNLIGDDATSKQTLEDLEENEVLPDESQDNASVPSPDGAFDESDELKDADPV